MYDITLRQWKDRYAKSICQLLPDWITPKAITLMAFISGLLACFTAAFGAPTPTLWPLILLTL